MAQTYDVKLFQRGGVTMVRYPDGDEAVLADVMRYMNPGMEYDQATGEQMATPPPPAESATYNQSTVREKPFGSIAGGMAEPYMSQAYDALTRTPVVDPNSYVPESVQRINQTLGNTGSAALSGLLGMIYGGAGLAGDAVNAVGIGGGQRLANDLAGMVDVAGVGPEARMVEMLSNAGAGRSIARTVAERANQRGPVPTMGSNFGNVLGDTLPAPRNEAEAIAKNILELRATGDVDAVTEGMMNAADPQYMYNYTPLPMDQASRMARAAEGQFDVNKTRYTGTESDIRDVNTDLGTGERYRTGLFTSTNPDVADSYISTEGGMIYPMVMRRNQGGVTIDAQGANWNRISPNSPANIPSEVLMAEFPELAWEKVNTAYDVAPNLFDDLFGKGASTNALARQRRFEGDSNITFENVVDRGAYQKTYLGETDEMAKARQRSASMPSDVRVDFYGNQVRSPFARFDPMFAHLRNLSAGVAISPLAYGLLSDQYEREQR